MKKDMAATIGQNYLGILIVLANFKELDVVIRSSWNIMTKCYSARKTINFKSDQIYV